MYIGLHVEYRLLFSDFDQTLKILDRFSKNTETSNVMKIRPMGAELLHTDRQTYTMKIRVAYPNFTKPPRKETHTQALLMLQVAQLPRHDSYTLRSLLILFG